MPFVPAALPEAELPRTSSGSDESSTSFGNGQLVEVLKYLKPSASAGDLKLEPLLEFPKYLGRDSSMMYGLWKCICDHCICEALAEPAAIPRNVSVNASYVPPRWVLRETVAVERLPTVCTPVSECAVVADVAAFSAGVVEKGSERLEQSTMHSESSARGNQ